MNRLIKKSMLVIMVFLVMPVIAENHTLKIMSFNVRFDNPDDGINQWTYRIPVVQAYMEQELPDIVGMQENLHHQNKDLLDMMPGYAYVGTGRDDGKKGGEFCPIFYRKDVFEPVEDGQFWLSENPHQPGSIGWEAVLPRIVTWIHLRHKASGEELFVFNTHFSHVSDLARKKSMEFMSEKMRTIAGDNMVVVTGDFNIRKKSPLYEEMADRFFTDNQLQNAASVAKELASGGESTFNGFRTGIEPRVIDFIFITPHFEVHRYAVDEVMKGEVFISDHWPLHAVISF